MSVVWLVVVATGVPVGEVVVVVDSIDCRDCSVFSRHYCC